MTRSRQQKWRKICNGMYIDLNLMQTCDISINKYWWVHRRNIYISHGSVCHCNDATGLKALHDAFVTPHAQVPGCAHGLE